MTTVGPLWTVLQKGDYMFSKIANACLPLLLLMSSPTEALTLTGAGVFDELLPYEDADYLYAEIGAGLGSSYTYEATIGDLRRFSQVVGVYEESSYAVTDFEFYIDGILYLSSSDDVESYWHFQIYNPKDSIYEDNFVLTLNSRTSPTRIRTASVFWHFDGAAFEGSALPIDQSFESIATRFYLDVNYCDKPIGQVSPTACASFNYDTFSDAVPEPASWALMIAGFGLCGAAARQRKYGSALASN